MSVNTDLQNAAIRHAIYSERYGRGLARRIVALLDAADADLTDQLQARLSRIEANYGLDPGPATTKRLTDLIESLQTINTTVYRRIGGALDAELIDLAALEIENQTATLTNALPVPVEALAPSPALLKTLVTTTPIDGYLLSSWTSHMSAARLGRVEKALRTGITEGQTVDQLVRRVRGTKAKGYKDGILNISRRSAETLCLTANSTIANKARGEVYKANSRLIRKLQWVSTLDTRTSSVCQSRDGKLYDLDEPHPTPPAHPRCRSVMIPVTVPFSELGLDADDYSPQKRASMDGQVAGNLTFGQWLKNQPESRVVELYGKERADLFLSGKVSFDDLYKQDGSFYSLAELRSRSAAPAPQPKAKAKPAAEPAPKAPTLADINAKHDDDMKAYTLTEGRKRGKEHLVVYDAATGKAFPPVTDGKKGSVSFPPWMLVELRNPANQIVLHHNHPSSSSFSPADLSIVHNFKGAKGIWAHGHNGSSYYAEAGPRAMSKQGYSYLQRQTQQWMQRKVNTKEITTDDANLIFYHVVTSLVGKRGYITYRADLQAETLEAFNRNKPLIEAFLSTFAGHSDDN